MPAYHRDDFSAATFTGDIWTSNLEWYTRADRSPTASGTCRTDASRWRCQRESGLEFESTADECDRRGPSTMERRCVPGAGERRRSFSGCSLGPGSRY